MATTTPDRLDTSRPAGVNSVVVQVLAATPAARDAVTFALALPGTRQAPAPYRPGQFITLAIPYAGATQYRSYSLCGDGSTNAPWEITVKRTKGGVISTYLLDHLRPGARLRTSLPQGTFTLAAARPGAPLIFVAAGSGITPLYGMLRALARLDPAQRPRVQLHYAYHGPADAIFGQQLAALDPDRSWLVQSRYISTTGRRLTAQAVLAAAGSAAASAEWFLCGPSALTGSVRAEALRWGVPEPRLHTEVFASPAKRPRRAAAGGARAGALVRLADSGVVLDAQQDETLLETLERAGYRPDFNCRAGACGTCRVRLLAGSVCGGAGESDALTQAEQAHGYVLSCVAQPAGDVTLATAGTRVAEPARGAAARGAGARPSRMRWRKPLRMGLSAAAVGLFVGMWSLTSHAVTTTSTASIATSTSSGATASGASAGTSSSSGSSTGSSSGSSSVTTQPSQSNASTSTGVS